MKVKSLIILPMLVVTLYSVYLLKLVGQLEVQQQEQIQSIQLLISTQTANINQLKLKLAAMSNQQNRLTFIPEDQEKYIAPNQTSEEMKVVNNKLNLLDIEQQRLSKSIQAYQQALSELSLQKNDSRVAVEKNSYINKSTEEILDNIRVEEEMAQQRIDSYWQEQTLVTDPWSQSTMITAKQALESVDGLNISEVDCTNKLCKLEIISTGDVDTSPDEALMMSDHEYDFYTQVKLNEDGSESFIIYLAGDGESLPEEMIN